MMLWLHLFFQELEAAIYMEKNWGFKFWKNMESDDQGKFVLNSYVLKYSGKR